ncbi:MAG TPA: T9SS type A sorting domain-containing protein [Hanamia sp.]|nr:T9SS type A sorting domain-containing protein [Hanamia sp.]
MRKKIYIFLLFTGLHFYSNAQVRPAQLLLTKTEKTVKFYPNPAVSFINFEFNKNYNNSYSLIIFNFLGKKIEELKVNDIKMTVSVADFYRGVYIFQLQDSHGNIIETGKFQVVK